ncbi:DMT family transporter [Paenibacillus sp. FJAT-27812]|uniref:DMT family transporter n=1 Tax=Paenibacillus sp. FJAT-27812 TaxID=1684143 RepID=UPI0006A7AC26|nr:multidrug efflux SMR transporter [Paenibacillus sp. FJAT-27812]
MAYLFLAISILGELIGTSMIKASQGFTKLYPVIATLISFTISFYFLSLTMKTIPLNTAYAIWSGVGAVATVLISVFIWKEKINAGSMVGIGLIVIGVIVLNLFGPGHDSADDSSKTASAMVQKTN